MEQLTLEINSTNIYQIEDFIITSANKQAYEKIISWQQNWGVLPLPYACIISGPESSGKTFLTKIFSKASGAVPINSLKSLNNDILSFYSAFIIDDIEHYHPTQILHYINILHEYKKPLLLTTRQKIVAYDLLDLNSRLNSILKIEVLPPDDELMKILLFKLFSTNSIQINNKILNFLLNKLPREFSSIKNYAARINSFSLIHKRNITLSLVKEALKELI